MPEYLAPGVFIEEIERGPRPIEGVPTSTAAFLGETERGPTRPWLVTSFNDYQRYFGGPFGPDKHMPYALSGFFENGGHRGYICRIVGNGSATAARTVGGLRIEAIGPGTAGNRIFVKLVPSTITTGPTKTPIGFRLQVAYWQTAAPGNAYPDPFDPAQARTLPRPTLTEDFNNLVWDDANSRDYFIMRLQDNSALVTVSPAAPGQPTALPQGGFGPLTGGTAGTTPNVNNYKGENQDISLRTGLSALELDDYREVALVTAPAAGIDVNLAVQEHCENNKFRFAVFDAPQGVGNASTLDPRTQVETSYGAFYYPWVYVADLQSGAKRLVPPSGHVLGLYARTDVERGVWKAPANDVLRGVVDLEYQVTTALQEVLNPRGVNATRQFPGRGIRVWGARTLSANTLWKYVSVRRLFIFLERSIYEGTQWVVFEPNSEALWERVKDTIRLFLRTQWRNGALMGTTEDQAFRIACDRSTMTDDDILNGRLICEIAIAPVRPAEFVIFRIFQNTVEAQS
jgi:phage tail sheath protein FI